MATAGDGAAPYEGGGAGGKFRKRPLRRSAQTTPYDRPPLALRNNNPSLFTKLVDPASRLIYAGAHRFFGVFRKRLPPPPPQRPSETNEEPRNGLQETVPSNCTGVSECANNQDGNVAGVSAATEISDLEQLLKQKTFTRTEVERLTALLHSRTAESPTDDGDKRKAENHGDERETAHAAISTPVFSSGVVEEDVASPAELAKAYMGTRSVKGSPSALSLRGSQRQIAALLNNTPVVPKTPIMSVVPKNANSFRGLENGFATPRSRGRSAIYSMARTPYSRVPSTFSQKSINSDYGHAAALTSTTLSHSAWEYGGPSGSLSKMALKRRSSVLDDDIGSGGPVRRTRQKSNLLSQGSFLSKHKREFGSSASQHLEAANGKLLLMDEPEPKASKRAEENGETSLHSSGYASVPTKSTQMATKILQQLERLTPKEKSAGSRLAEMSEKSPTKLTPSMLHGQARRSLEKLDSAKFLPSSQDNKNSEDTYHPCLPGASASTSQSKDKVEENVPRKFAVPRNMLSSMNGDSTVPLRDSAPAVTSTDSTLKFVAEPPQKKRAFQMSAHEDSWELDDEIHSNGHVPIPTGENKRTETSVVENKAVSAEVLPGIIKTSPLPETTKNLTLPEAAKIPLPEVSRTAELSEVVRTPAPSEAANTPGPSEVAKGAALPEVTKTPAPAELIKPDDYVSPVKGDYRSSGVSVVGEQKVGFSFPNSSPSSTTTQSVVPSESTSLVDKVAPQKDSSVFPSFGTNLEGAEKASLFPFSANQPSESKSNAGPTSIFNSVMKNDQVKFPASNKDDNSNGQTPGNIFGKSEPLSSATSAVTSTSGIFQFGGSAKSSSTTNGTPASSPAIFSSTPFSASGNNTNQLFNNSSSNATSSGSTAAIASTASTVSSSVFSTSASAPTFSFGSAVAPSTSASTVTTASGAGATDTKADKDPKFNSLSSSPFASTSFATASTGSSFFGFSSPAATSTTSDNQSQGSFFNAASGSQTVPFQFGSSATTVGSGTTGTSSSTLGSSPFGSSPPAFGSAPSFGLSSAVASLETKSGSSASTGVFGSSWQPPKSSPFGSTFSSPATGFAFGASSTSTPSVSSSPIMFGSSNAGASTGSSMFSFTAAAATNSSFPAPSQAQSVFGSSTPVFGGATTSLNNNDQMTMEDSMAEDSMQTPTPVPTFGQAPSPAAAPGFMFGSATPSPAPAPAPTLPFQFGGQPNQAPPQNPFQSSGSVEFNAGGSFSLGSGGGDKSGRRFVKVKSKNRRK